MKKDSEQKKKSSKGCSREITLRRASKVVNLLREEYGMEYKCYLDHQTPEQLLIATMLSAQCTDARVNQVTVKLFAKYPTVEAFAKAQIKELEQDIFSTGFYHNKAKNIIACCQVLMEKYNGQVPSDIDLLVALPGVGRKTANVIRGNIFEEPSIVVDTHVKRISARLGLTQEEDPVKIEFALMEILPKEDWIRYNIHIIKLGREICVARSPKCELCFLHSVCAYYGKDVEFHD